MRANQPHQAVPRSRLRRGLSHGGQPRHHRAPRPPPRGHRSRRNAGRRARLPCRQGRDARGCRSGRPVRNAGAVPQGLPGGAARSAAEHVPGLRLPARRPAHAAHDDDPVGLGLLRLRADLHLAFLRRAPECRLRAVQLRDARHRQAVRGHPRRGLRLGQPARLRRDRRHQPLRPNRVGRAAAAAAEADRRGTRDRHRRAGLRRADPCRGQGRAGRRHAQIRPQRGGERPGPGAARGPLGASVRRASGRDVPRRSRGDRCTSRTARPQRRPRRADARMARTLRRPRRGGGGGDPSVLHRERARVRGGRAAGGRLRPVGHDGTADWLEAIGKACDVPRDAIAAAQNRLLPAIRGRWPRRRSAGASRSRVTRARNS